MTEKSAHFITVEFHCHSIYSYDSSNRIQALIDTAREHGIDKLAITDHNTIQGALLAKDIAPELIIISEEVLTRRGELLAYFLKEEVPANLTVAETLKRFKAQGAFIAIPHPLDWHRHGWGREELLELLPEVDAIEIFNARSFRRIHNDRAHAFAAEHNMPAFAGSDAHSLYEFGFAKTRLPDFSNAEELRMSIKHARVEARKLSFFDHIKANMRVAFALLSDPNAETA